MPGLSHYRMHAMHSEVSKMSSASLSLNLRGTTAALVWMMCAPRLLGEWRGRLSGKGLAGRHYPSQKGSGACNFRTWLRLIARLG